MADEQWLPVTDFEGLYEVSDCGRVRSVPRTFTRYRRGKPVEVAVQGKILAQTRHPQGYMQVQLPRTGPDGRQRNCRLRVNVLMLEAFVGPRPDGEVARHWNDVPDDNRLENLRWGTPSQNRHDSVRNGTHGYARRTHCKNGHEFTPENTRIRKNGARECLECQRQSGGRYARSERGRTRQREYMRNYRKEHPRDKADPKPKTHCVNGHEYTPKNTHIDKAGKRHCRECQRIQNRAHYARTHPKGDA